MGLSTQASWLRLLITQRATRPYPFCRLAPGYLRSSFKLSFIRPAVGQAIRARGKVRKLGRTLALCEIVVETSRHRKWVSCAWGSETVYCDIVKPQSQPGHV